MSAEHESEEILEVDNTEPDDANVGLITTITLVGAFLVIAIAGALTALYRSESAAYSDEVGGYANLGQVQRLKSEQNRKLEGDYTWTDEKNKKLVALPIDRAMELVSSEIRRDPTLATPNKPEGETGAASPEAGADGTSEAGALMQPSPTPSDGASAPQSAQPTQAPQPNTGEPVQPAKAGPAQPVKGGPSPKKGANPSPAVPPTTGTTAPKGAPTPTRQAPPPAPPAPPTN